MAQISTAAAGNWSSGTTWSGGVPPGNGDQAIINHAVIVDTNTIVGTSQPGFTATGLNNFAIIVNGPYNVGYELNTVSSLFQNGTGTPSLTIAAGKSLTVRGDCIMNCSQLILSQGASYIFDSSQAANPTAQNYVLEVINSYNSFNAAIVCNGVAGNRCVITSAAGGGNGRITAGEKILGYEAYGSGLCQWSYTNATNLGTSALPAIAFRPTSPATFSMSHVKFTACGRILPQASSIQPATNLIFTSVSFIGGIDTSTPGQQISPGSDICLQDDGNGPVTGTRSFTNCFFGLSVGLYQTQGLVCTGCVFAGSWLSSAQSPVWVFQNCLNYMGEGYPGGLDTTVAHGSTVNNCYWIEDSTYNLNSHFLAIRAGTGNTTITNNIFDLERIPSGYYGGNCIIGHANTSGTLSTCTLTITHNIVLGAGNTMPSGLGFYTVGGGPAGTGGAGECLAAGTLFTGLDSNQQYSVVIEYNTAVIPAGIGSVDPDENAQGVPGYFKSIRNNIFWNLGTTVGECVWWNTNGHARNPSIDSVLATNLDYNVKWHADTASVSYLNNPTSWASPSTPTPGYKDGWFSSSTPPGVHDIYANNQQFLDNTRSVITYDALQGGPGTAAHFMSQIALMNEDSGYNTAYGILPLIAWVRAGFAPTNGTVFRASSNRDTPGAVQMAAPIIAAQVE